MSDWTQALMMQELNWAQRYFCCWMPESSLVRCWMQRYLQSPKALVMRRN
jgi:hypothetical protein